jgi:hypothetical protein
MAVGVNIVSTFDSKGIQRAISDFKKIEGAGNKAAYSLRTFDKGMTNTLKAVSKLAAGVAVAAGAIGYSLVKSAIQAQAEQDRLRQILLTTGAATEKQVTSLIAQAEALEKVGVASAGNIITAQSQLATFDLQFETIQKLTPAITDYVIAEKGATATAEDFKSMTNGLAQALNGQFGALTKAGFVLDENTKGLISNGSEAERASAIVDVLSSTYAGFNEAIAKTPEGRMVALRNSFESLRTELGGLLLPAFEKIVAFLQAQFIPYLQRLTEIIGEKGVGAAIKTMTGDLLNAISGMGAFGNSVLFVIGTITAVRTATVAYNATIAVMNVLNSLAKAGFLGTALGVKVLNMALKANTIGLIIAAITIAITVITFLIMKFKFLRDAIAAVGNAVKAAWGWLKGLVGMGDKATVAIKGVAENAGAMREKEGGVQNVAKAFKEVGNTASGAGKTVATAKEKLEKYIDALKGMSSAQKSARDADKSLMKSRTSLADATTKLTDAQAYFNQVVAGYGADSKQAKDRQLALRKAQGAVEKAGYDVEGAVFAVAKAEQELADLRKDPETSAQAIREAEISLAQAKLGVKDATEEQVEATDALTEAEQMLDETINGAKEGSDAYTDALDRLNDAKRSQVDATDAVTEAIERQTEATDRLREAETKAQEARTGVKAGAATAAETQAGIAPPPSAPAVQGGGYGSFMEAVRGLHPNSPALRSGTPVTDARKQFPKLYAEYKAAGLAMAQGGIITKPTQVLAGENGKEAIIPLDRLQSGMTVNVTVNAGMGADAATIGDEIVNVLQRYNRRNGALPLKVA